MYGLQPFRNPSTQGFNAKKESSKSDLAINGVMVNKLSYWGNNFQFVL